MTEVLRPSLYGAQHPTVLIKASVNGDPEGTRKRPREPSSKPNSEPINSSEPSSGNPPAVPSASGRSRQYIVVGHCCESGDLVTPAPDEPEVLLRRALGTSASIDDLIVIEGSGAYCSSMSTKNYNSFPEAPEVLLASSGKAHLIRKKQEVKEIWANEVPYTPA